MKSTNSNKDSNFIYLMGGLGNQLFQLAAGIYYSHQQNKRLIIDDSFGNFRRDSKGNADLFALTHGQLDRVQQKSKISYILNRSIGLQLRISLNSGLNILNKVFSLVLRNINSFLLSIRFHSRVKVFIPSDLGYQSLPKSGKTNYFVGYFQTYIFASNNYVNNELRRLILTKSNLHKFYELANLEIPLIVHVRLGDYLENLKFGVLSRDYYQKSISWMMEEYSLGKIWVFSDDINLAKNYIPTEFHSLCRWEGNKFEAASETLEKMRMGKAYVIGNSTLSWWGAFLSYTPNAPTIAPNPWFVGIREPNALIPGNWIRQSR